MKAENNLTVFEPDVLLMGRVLEILGNPLRLQTKAQRGK